MSKRQEIRDLQADVDRVRDRVVLLHDQVDTDRRVQVSLENGYDTAILALQGAVSHLNDRITQALATDETAMSDIYERLEALEHPKDVQEDAGPVEEAWAGWSPDTMKQAGGPFTFNTEPVENLRLQEAEAVWQFVIDGKTVNAIEFLSYVSERLVELEAASEMDGEVLANLRANGGAVKNLLEAHEAKLAEQADQITDLNDVAIRLQDVAWTAAKRLTELEGYEYCDRCEESWDDCECRYDDDVCIDDCCGEDGDTPRYFMWDTDTLRPKSGVTVGQITPATSHTVKFDPDAPSTPTTEQINLSDLKASQALTSIAVGSQLDRIIALEDKANRTDGSLETDLANIATLYKQVDRLDVNLGDRIDRTDIAQVELFEMLESRIELLEQHLRYWPTPVYYPNPQLPINPPSCFPTKDPNVWGHDGTGDVRPPDKGWTSNDTGDTNG